MSTLQELKAEINEDSFSLSAFKGLTAAYNYLGFGTPTINGYMALIASAESTNLGSSVPLNDENIYINTMNALYQGNSDARAHFDAIVAGGATLQAKLGLVYDSIIPADQRSDAGRAYFVSQADFYMARADELGISGLNGAALVGAAALTKIVVDNDIRGIGDGITDLVKAVNDGSAAIPESGGFTPIETADGTNHDSDDAPSVIPDPEPEIIYVPVPVPTPVDVTFKVGTGSLVESSLDANGYVEFGTGNLGTFYSTTTVRGGGDHDVQIGGSPHIRAANDPHLYNEGHLSGDEVSYTALGGSQKIANGSQSDNANRSQTNVDLTFNFDALGTTGDTAADYDAFIHVDIDPTAAVNFVTYQMDHTDPNVQVFVAQGGYFGALGDEAPQPWLYSDSFNFAFVDTDPVTAGQQGFDLNTLYGDFDIKLEVYDRGTANLVAEHVMHIQLVAVNPDYI